MSTYMIRGREWTVQREKLASDTDGDCCHKTRAIRIRHGLKGKDNLWTVIHEVIHAALPDLNEDATDSVAFSLTEVLMGEGYRRRNG